MNAKYNYECKNVERERLHTSDIVTICAKYNLLFEKDFEHLPEANSLASQSMLIPILSLTMATEYLNTQL